MLHEFSCSYKEYVDGKPSFPANLDRIDNWCKIDYHRQMIDLWGEVNKIVGYLKEDEIDYEAVSQKFNTLHELCLTLYQEPDVIISQGLKYELKEAEWELHDFIWGENLFRNNVNTIAKWWNQWMFSSNLKELL